MQVMTTYLDMRECPWMKKLFMGLGLDQSVSKLKGACLRLGKYKSQVFILTDSQNCIVIVIYCFSWARWEEIVDKNQLRKGWTLNVIEDCARIIVSKDIVFY